MELSSRKIRKFLMFSQKKVFLIFREIELFKNSFYILVRNFLSSKNKKNSLKRFLIFREMELFSPSLKNSYSFSKE